MRQIVLDTETTGLEWKKGNRVVEIGGIELIGRKPSGRTFHHYLRPDCAFEPGAAEVTGLTLEFLADKPKFAEIADAFLAFVDGAELIIHNAAFDMGFLEYELTRLPGTVRPLRERVSVLDTLMLARERYPGQRNSLDALCKRLNVDNAHRQLHGALLDAELLAEVYLALTAGQDEIDFGSLQPAPALQRRVQPDPELAHLPRSQVTASAEELAQHAARLEAIRRRAGRCVWDDLTDHSAHH